MVTSDQIVKASKLLAKAANPEKIILFGSYARAEARSDSDIDIMVIEREIDNRVAEMVRLNREIASLRLPIDLLVVSRGMFEKWSDTPGNVYYRAKKEGKVLYESA
ncbi:nucleotidyltransferase domain-containing protein [Geoalkalibacter halelectricus]|uniref:Nucleotidyltransferase domain-containing protein n=1 Tax=Geoalkalibacter halelectricus TaxID=2847045 RepID=A0ABY5ZMG9_9BACT|nr:nucleotidyltransferase domain-containing protein [Geoalkalibacter halelectricus]MDO3379710.1 nucleotidyltransferase domain-containing protein [Geoalkalibacter halelectricus]UWZ79679.1 nucleotidyltransferase domain-containing protein [Geoalkalibacter halelectricus]